MGLPARAWRVVGSIIGSVVGGPSLSAKCIIVAALVAAQSAYPCSGGGGTGPGDGRGRAEGEERGGIRHVSARQDYQLRQLDPPSVIPFVPRVSGGRRGSA